MPLTNDEFRNRVKAAAALHGKGMREARDHLEEFGADRTLAEAIIPAAELSEHFVSGVTLHAV